MRRILSESKELSQEVWAWFLLGHSVGPCVSSVRWSRCINEYVYLSKTKRG